MAKNKKTPKKSSKNIPHTPRRRWLKITGYVLGGLLALFLTAPFWNPIVFPPVTHVNVGTSFSTKRAQELSIDWKAAFTALLDEMDIRHFRLMSYWDDIEQSRGDYTFSDLDWQMDEAAKRGAKVSLSIGLRQPRWPECHQPKWALTLKGHEWKQALYASMKTVVKRYEHHPALESWQLENEAVNNWFGTCDPPDVARINEEFKLVKAWSKKPVYMSLSDQHGLPINPPTPDKYGYSVYRTVWSDKTWPYIGYLTYPTPIWYHRARAAVIQLSKDRDIFIHELQLEPWGPIDTRYLSKQDQDKSMDKKQIKENLYFARMIGTPDIYTWGSEWWYWRKVNGDPSIWNTVKQEFDAVR